MHRVKPLVQFLPVRVVWLNTQPYLQKFCLYTNHSIVSPFEHYAHPLSSVHKIWRPNNCFTSDFLAIMLLVSRSKGGKKEKEPPEKGDFVWTGLFIFQLKPIDYCRRYVYFVTSGPETWKARSVRWRHTTASLPARKWGPAAFTGLPAQLNGAEVVTHIGGRTWPLCGVYL